ncbi:MAG TPA: chemotaxis protein CheX [Polyangiaceae bacterium]|nr:chemotaxis protein CheX [Polyangiaceae bacterium]
MDVKSLTVLDDIIVGACRAVFEGAGAPLEQTEATQRETDDIGASIGFTGTTLRGSLVLISSKRLIKGVLPVAVGRGSESAQIADWMGELSNQTLGRIKNRLLAYGVTLEMSTPTVLFGLSISRRDTGSIVRREFSFRHGGETLSVSLDALASPGFELSRNESAIGAGVAEGEIALF